MLEAETYIEVVNRDGGRILFRNFAPILLFGLQQWHFALLNAVVGSATTVCPCGIASTAQLVAHGVCCLIGWLNVGVQRRIVDKFACTLSPLLSFCSQFARSLQAPPFL